MLTSFDQRRRFESLDAAQLADHQLARLNGLFAAVLPANRFYADKLAGSKLPLGSLDDLAALPCTTKEELLGDDPAGLPAHLTFPPARYVRFHQTSGTRGRPLAVLDTAEDWQWWLDCWQYVLDAADLGPDDRALMAFSFGPFIGFWSAYDAAAARGCLVVPGGGLSTLARLELARSSRATALFCTPSYAQRMVEVAAEHAFDLTQLAIRRIVVAGEPGGSIPEVRTAIEAAFDARVIDHAGASEIGAWGYADRQRRGLHVLESEFVAEFRSLRGDRPAAPGELAELVLTSLGRVGAPVIRYRTGDLVRPAWDAAEGACRFVLLEGGVLGRADDMVIVRGVNIFPSSIESIVRGFPEISAFRITARREGAMDRLSVEIEDPLDQPQRLAEALHLRLGLHVEVTCVSPGTLPRSDGKARRFVDLRRASRSDSSEG